MLLNNSSNATTELELFLSDNSESIPPVELGRTQRQMQFFVDTLKGYEFENEIIKKMQKAIKIIDDCMKYEAVWE